MKKKEYLILLGLLAFVVIIIMWRISFVYGAEICPQCEEGQVFGQVTKAATCTETGIKTWTCSERCGYTYEEEIPATGHTWKYETNADGGTHKHICTVCGETDIASESCENFYGEWIKDAYVHYKTCSRCGGFGHSGEHKDTNNDGKCDICSYSGMPVVTPTPTPAPTHTHSWKYETNTDGGTHKHICTGCGETDIASESCENFYGEWIKDAYVHYKTCSRCGGFGHSGEHKDTNNDGKCDICSYSGMSVETPAPTHTHDWAYVDSQSGTHEKICRICQESSTENCYGGTIQFDTEEHFKICEGCGERYEEGEHKDTNGDGNCDVCGYIMNCAHTWIYGKSNNPSAHIKVCQNCNIYFMEPHEDKNNDAKCDKCGETVQTNPTPTPTSTSTSTSPTPTKTSGGGGGGGGGGGVITPLPTANNYKRGDANVSGSVTITDLILIKKHLVDAKKLEGQGLNNADVNQNGNVDITDLLLCKQYLVGISTSYTW